MEDEIVSFLFPEFIPPVSKGENKVTGNLQRTGVHNAVTVNLPAKGEVLIQYIISCKTQIETFLFQ